MGPMDRPCKVRLSRSQWPPASRIQLRLRMCFINVAKAGLAQCQACHGFGARDRAQSLGMDDAVTEAEDVTGTDPGTGAVQAVVDVLFLVASS